MIDEQKLIADIRYSEQWQNSKCPEWVIRMIESQPTRTQKNGYWITIERGEQGYSAGDFRCSVCGEPNRCYSMTDYCASCGAKMRDKVQRVRRLSEMLGTMFDEGEQDER